MTFNYDSFSLHSHLLNEGFDSIVSEGEFYLEIDGEIYDENIKKELFNVSDFYFHPAWTGLSVVEALLHNLPVLSLKRSNLIHQSVEYGYLIDDYNAILTDTIDELINKLDLLTLNKILTMKKNTFKYASQNLSMDLASKDFVSYLKRLLK